MIKNEPHKENKSLRFNNFSFLDYTFKIKLCILTEINLKDKLKQ